MFFRMNGEEAQAKKLKRCLAQFIPLDYHDFSSSSEGVLDCRRIGFDTVFPTLAWQAGPEFPWIRTGYGQENRTQDH